MNEEIIIEPVILMTLHDEMFGDQPVYSVSDFLDIEEIYDYRIAKEITENGTNDDFFFLADCNKLGLESSDKKFIDLSKIVSTPILYKAYFQDVGNFFEPVKSTELGLTSSIENIRGSSFTLPRIPPNVVAVVDTFLHAVHKKYQSEGIVLLTYDMDFLYQENDEKGWSIAVPEQSNNAQHCDYDKAQIVEKLIGTNIRIVGTIHSHPNMAAYASQTDHEDQTGFDGLHITFGWKNTGGKIVKEYHSELVRGDSFYKIDNDLVMDLAPQFQYEIELESSKAFVGPESVERVIVFTGPDGEQLMVPSADVVETNKVTVSDGESYLVDHLEKLEYETPVDENEINNMIEFVQKKIVNYNSYQNDIYQQNTSGGHKLIKSKDSNPKNQAGGLGKAQGPHQGLKDSYEQKDFYPSLFPTQVIVFPKLDTFPDPENNIIFARIPKIKINEECPACENAFGFSLSEVVDRRQCLGCGIYFLIENESFIEVNDHRVRSGYLSFEDIFPDDLHIVIWDVKKEKWETLKGDSKKALA
jgi:proteasome lid subunit RPN8/RPN11